MTAALRMDTMKAPRPYEGLSCRPYVTFISPSIRNYVMSYCLRYTVAHRHTGVWTW
jgi:hypothetical protein